MTEKKSIIKDSDTLKAALKERIKELGLTYTQIAEDAKRWDITNVKIETISRYFSGAKRGSMNEEGILFLAFRYGITVTLNIGAPTIQDGKYKSLILPYDEERAIGLVNKIWDERKEKKNIKSKG